MGGPGQWGTRALCEAVWSWQCLARSVLGPMAAMRRLFVLRQGALSPTGMVTVVTVLSHIHRRSRPQRSARLGLRVPAAPRCGARSRRLEPAQRVTSATSHCSGRLGPAASERGVRVKKAGIVITVASGLATRDRTAGGAAAGIETEGLTVRNPRVSSGQAHFQRQSEANRGENPPA